MVSYPSLKNIDKVACSTTLGSGKNVSLFRFINFWNFFQEYVYQCLDLFYYFKKKLSVSYPNIRRLGLHLFKWLRLLFLANVPGATFMPNPMSIFYTYTVDYIPDCLVNEDLR